jgi:hypothetical protein
MGEPKRKLLESFGEVAYEFMKILSAPSTTVQQSASSLDFALSLQELFTLLPQLVNHAETLKFIQDESQPVKGAAHLLLNCTLPASSAVASRARVHVARQLGGLHKAVRELNVLEEGAEGEPRDGAYVMKLLDKQLIEPIVLQYIDVLPEQTAQEKDCADERQENRLLRDLGNAFEDDLAKLRSNNTVTHQKNLREFSIGAMKITSRALFSRKLIPSCLHVLYRARLYPGEQREYEVRGEPGFVDTVIEDKMGVYFAQLSERLMDEKHEEEAILFATRLTEVRTQPVWGQDINETFRLFYQNV